MVSCSSLGSAVVDEERLKSSERFSVLASMLSVPFSAVDTGLQEGNRARKNLASVVP